MQNVPRASFLLFFSFKFVMSSYAQTNLEVVLDFCFFSFLLTICIRICDYEEVDVIVSFFRLNEIRLGIAHQRR